MASSAQLIIEILTKADGAVAGLDKASDSAGKFQRGIGKAAGVAAAGLVAVAGVAMDCASSASDLQQSFGGLDAVFGSNSQQMKDWANNAADSMGLSATAYAEGATKIGAQLKNLGVPMKDVGGQTNDLMQMAADLAATFGGSTAEAVDALGSAFRGEADPAERYGLALNQTKINAQMAADGTDKLTGKAYDAAKAQTIMKLATQQSADSLGKFAEESDTAAGAQQQATANFENAKAALGTALLPTLTKVAGALAGFAKWIEKNSTVVVILVGILGTLAVAIMLVNVAMMLIAANPIVLIIVGIVAAVALLVAGFVLLWKKCDGFRNAMTALWAGMKTGIAAIVAGFQKIPAAVSAVAARIRGAFAAVWNWLKSQAATVANFVKSVFQRIASPIAAVATRVKAAFNTAFNAVKSVARTVANAIKAAFSAVAGPVMAVASRIKSAFVGAFNSLKAAARGVKGALMAPFNAIKNAINGAIGAVRDLIGWISRIKIPKISIPGFGGKSAAASAPATLRSAANPRLASRVGATATTTAGGVVINISGAMDPEAVARQIRSVLSGASVRRQGVVLAART